MTEKEFIKTLSKALHEMAFNTSATSQIIFVRLLGMAYNAGASKGEYFSSKTRELSMLAHCNYASVINAYRQLSEAGVIAVRKGSRAGIGTRTEIAITV